MTGAPPPTDPPRLREDPGTPSELRALLEAAGPTSGLPADAGRRLAEHVETLGPAPTWVGRGGPWLAGGGLALVAGIAWLALGGTPAPEETPAAPVRADPGESPPPAAPAPTPASAEPVAEPAPPPPPAVEPVPRRAPRAAPAPADALAAEQRLVERARGRLAGGDAAGALRATGRHARRFPDGQLVAEREFVAIRALRVLGRDDEATARRARFLARFPDSPYAALLR